MSRSDFKIVSALIISVVALPNITYAGETIQMHVTANVIAVCKVNTASDIHFGGLDPSQAVDVTANGNISFMCTKGVDYKMTVGRGLYFDNESQRRQMKSLSNDYLPYSIKDEEISGVGTGFTNPTSLNVAARISASDYKDLPAGVFSDTIRILIEP